MSKVFNVFKLPSVMQTVIQGVQGVLVQNIQIGLSVIQTVIQGVQGVLVHNIQIGLSVFSVQEQ